MPPCPGCHACFCPCLCWWHFAPTAGPSRPLAEAIGDTRVHFNRNWRRHDEEIFEAESSFPATAAEALRALGWKVDLVEAAGTGGNFGGINALELMPGSGYTGYADPRRTNAAAGY